MQLWRDDTEFEADWFLLELEGTEPDWVPTEEDLREYTVEPAQLLLRDPQAAFRQLSRSRMLMTIDSPDARFNVRVALPETSISVQVLEDARAAARLCEFLDNVYGGYRSRIRVMPDENAGPFVHHEGRHIFGRVIARRKTPVQTINLWDHPVYGRGFSLDREIQLAESDEHLYSSSFVSHASSNSPKRVLILGGGDCGILREVLERPVERVVMVELDREVVRFCEEHFPAIVGSAPDDPRVELRFEDAFAYLAECEERFDLVLSDLPDVPIANYSLDDQLGLMSRVLTENGTLATHTEIWQKEEMVEAIARQFETVEVNSVVIPSFQEAPWSFVRASGQR